MANKCRLKVTVLGILLLGLAGCQMLSDGVDQVQAAVETEASTENYQTEQVPAIQGTRISCRVGSICRAWTTRSGCRMDH